MTTKPQFSIRVSEGTLAKLRAEAEVQGRKVGNLISHILDQHVDKTAKDKK